MKALLLLGCAALGLAAAARAQAVILLHWQRLPLAVPLLVGQERVVFVDRNVRVGVPSAIADRLRVQSAGGAIYLRASAPIEPTRLQLQDASNGALILVDIDAQTATAGQAALEPVRIVQEASPDAPAPSSTAASDDEAATTGEASTETPVPVVLTRYAAQSLYAPLRTVEPVEGLVAAPVDRSLSLTALLPALSVRAQALASWRLADTWVTAVRLTHTSPFPVTLDPRRLQGDFVAATFQHPDLGPMGQPSDTTVVYLVTRGHGLRGALLPTRADAAPGTPHEK